MSWSHPSVPPRADEKNKRKQHGSVQYTQMVRVKSTNLFKRIRYPQPKNHMYTKERTPSQVTCRRRHPGHTCAPRTPLPGHQAPGSSSRTRHPPPSPARMHSRAKKHRYTLDIIHSAKGCVCIQFGYILELAVLLMAQTTKCLL